jgi:SAM-dependent methyltransferase
MADEHANSIRALVAARYLSGDGLEVGALHKPVPVGPRARVRYVDRLTRADALVHYPELLPHRDAIVEPDIVDDGETLATVPGGSQDFVIANHFLEHCENPLATLRNHVRVLRPGGRLMLAVPNAMDPGGWDRARELTTFAHLVRDDREGPLASRAAHYWEWVTITNHLTGEAAEADRRRLMDLRYSIHFHCWTPATFLPFLHEAIAYAALDVFVVYYETSLFEMIAVLERPSPERPAGALEDETGDVRAEVARLRAECDRLNARDQRMSTELEALRRSAVVRVREWLRRARGRR